MRFTRADENSRYGRAIAKAATDAAREIVLEALRRHEGRIVDAADWLGVTPAVVYGAIDRLGLGLVLDSIRAKGSPGRRGRPPVPRGPRG